MNKDKKTKFSNNNLAFQINYNQIIYNGKLNRIVFDADTENIEIYATTKEKAQHGIHIVARLIGKWTSCRKLV